MPLPIESGKGTGAGGIESVLRNPLAFLPDRLSESVSVWFVLLLCSAFFLSCFCGSCGWYSSVNDSKPTASKPVANMVKNDFVMVLD